jgi:hypothetical protein
VVIEGASTNECPVSISLRFPELFDMLTLINRSRRIGESFHTSPLGPDLSNTPARFVDALDLVAIEDIRVNNAMTEAARD